MENYFQYFTEIIKASSTGPLGILALIILIIGILAYHFFRNERAAIKLTVFFTLVGMSMVSFAMSFYNTEVFVPNVDHSADVGDISDHGSSEQPTPAVPLTPSRPSVAMVPTMRPAQPILPSTQPSRTLETVTDTATLPSTDVITRTDVTLSDRSTTVGVGQDCGTAWSDWIKVGKGVGNPCPMNCNRGNELGKSIRMVGFPPRPQVKHKFQCWK